MCEHVLGENSVVVIAAMNCGCYIGVIVSAAFRTRRVTHVINY